MTQPVAQEAFAAVFTVSEVALQAEPQAPGRLIGMARAEDDDGMREMPMRDPDGGRLTCGRAVPAAA